MASLSFDQSLHKFLYGSVLSPRSLSYSKGLMTHEMNNNSVTEVGGGSGGTIFDQGCQVLDIFNPLTSLVSIVPKHRHSLSIDNDGYRLTSRKVDNRHATGRTYEWATVRSS